MLQNGKITALTISELFRDNLWIIINALTFNDPFFIYNPISQLTLVNVTRQIHEGEY